MYGFILRIIFSKQARLTIMREKSLLIFSLTFCSGVSGLSTSLSPIHVQDGNFVDQDGRVRMFRGINSVIKHYPW